MFRHYLINLILITCPYTEGKFISVLQPKAKKYLQLRKTYLSQRTGSLLLRTGSLK